MLHVSLIDEEPLNPKTNHSLKKVEEFKINEMDKSSFNSDTIKMEITDYGANKS